MSILFAITPREGAAPQWYFARTPNEVTPVADDALGDHRADRTVWLVPGTDVSLADIDVTARSAADQRIAALYQLEDELSEQVSRLHIAIGPKRADQLQQRDAAVISQKRMDEILGQLDLYPAEFSANVEVVPETSLFRMTGAPVIYDGDDRLIVSDGANEVLAIDPVVGHDLLPALVHQLSIGSADVYSGSSALLPGIQLPAQFVATEIEPISFAQFVSSPLLAGEGIDLRQAEYAPKRQFRIGISGWTSTLVLAGAAFAIWLVASMVSVAQLESETDSIYDGMVSAYAESFPDEGTVDDPRRAVALKLGDATSGAGTTGFIDLAAVFYAGIREVEGVELDGYSYDQSTGRLTATLRFSGYQDRDQLKQIFDRQGVPITLGGARQDNGALVGEAILGGSLS